MTTEHQASRTLVKSPPELWAECSDPGSLARHIGEFGEIRITRLEPETSVSWEAERASGTVEIKPSGWGTRVTLTAQTRAGQAVIEPAEVGVPLMGPVRVDTEEEADPVPEADARPFQEAPEQPETESDPVEEEADATVEETHAEPDPGVAAAAGPAGRRWKRLIARTRAWLGSAGKPPQAPETPGPADARPEEVSEPEIVTSRPKSAVQELSVAETSDPPGPSDPPAPSVEAAPPDDADRAPSLDPDAVLIAALDSLGQAHHRPFSRA
jgi:hypothetical protein